MGQNCVKSADEVEKQNTRGNTLNFGGLNNTGGSEGQIGQIDWTRIRDETQSRNLEIMKEDLEKNMEMFILNNVLMGVQFLKHYEKDKESNQHKKDKIKEEFEVGLREFKKNCIVPATIFAKVHDNMNYKFDEDTKENLHTHHEVLICYNNIEVNKKEDLDMMKDGTMQYVNVDNPIYKVCLDYSKEHKGYVKLLCVEDYASKHGSSASKVSDEEETQARGITTKSEPSPVKNSVRFMDTVGEEDEEEEESMINGHSGELPRKVFAPSEKEINRLQLQQVPTKQQLKERRQSGVVPWSQISANQRSEQFHQKKLKEKQGAPNRQTSRGLAEPKNRNLIPVGKGTLIEEGDYVRYEPVSLASIAPTDKRLSSGSIMPDTCFKRMGVQIENDEIDEDMQEAMKDLAETEFKTFLGSRGFMDHFISQFRMMMEKLNKSQLANEDNCHTKRPAIYAQEPNGDRYFVWSFIPTVEVGFMNDDTYMFLHRNRKSVTDSRTGVTYQWPTQDQIDALKTMGFNVVPKGFVYPRIEHKNVEEDIEWEVRFDKLEQLLFRSLHYPKVKVYLFMMLIFKQFFKEFGGIKEIHFRHQLFWLLEKEPVGWTEENLGEKLLKLLKHIVRGLSKETMMHYFVKDWNILQNVSKHRIREDHEKMYRIMEKPVANILEAVHHLEYHNFYPPLNVKELVKILTMSETKALTKLNPLLKEQGHKGEEKIENPAKHIVLDEYQRKMMERRENMGQRQQPTEAAATDKGNVKALLIFDEDFTIPKSESSDPRKALLLEFFLKHTINMAQQSNMYRNYGQGLMYVLHAENLLKILSENPVHNDTKARSFRGEIEKLKDVTNLELYTKEYFNIGFSHTKLTSSSSFRQSMEVQRMLPDPPLQFLTPPTSPDATEMPPEEDSHKTGGESAAGANSSPTNNSLFVMADIHEEEDEETEEVRGEHNASSSPASTPVKQVSEQGHAASQEEAGTSEDSKSTRTEAVVSDDPEEFSTKL